MTAEKALDERYHSVVGQYFAKAIFLSHARGAGRSGSTPGHF